jgi:uncharacterized Zn finger protein (UPF0148 family)
MALQKGRCAMIKNCTVCKKVLFKTKSGDLACPNGCEAKLERTNSMIDDYRESAKLGRTTWGYNFCK